MAYLSLMQRTAPAGSGLPPVRVQHESISATQRYCHPDCNRCIDSSIDCMIDCETKELVYGYAPPAQPREPQPRQPPAPRPPLSRVTGRRGVSSNITMSSAISYKKRNWQEDTSRDTHGAHARTMKAGTGPTQGCTRTDATRTCNQRYVGNIG